MLSVSLIQHKRRPIYHHPDHRNCESTVEKISLLINRATAVRAAHAEKGEAFDEIVPDPYYGNLRDFEDVADMLMHCAME